MAALSSSFLTSPFSTKNPSISLLYSTNFTLNSPIFAFPKLSSNSRVFPRSKRSILHTRPTTFAFLKDGLGQVKKKLDDVTSLNYWVVRDYYRLVDSVNGFEPRMQSLSDEQLKGKTEEFRRRLALGESLADIQAEAFAVVREAAKRTLGMRHFDVQIIGGAVLNDGSIAEMKTGEGKTLVSTLAAYLNASFDRRCTWFDGAAVRSTANYACALFSFVLCFLAHFSDVSTTMMVKPGPVMDFLLENQNVNQNGPVIVVCLWPKLMSK